MSHDRLDQRYFFRPMLGRVRHHRSPRSSRYSRGAHLSTFISWRRLDNGNKLMTYQLGFTPDWETIVRDVCAEFHCWPEQVDLDEGREEDGSDEGIEFITVRGERVVRKDYVA